MTLNLEAFGREFGSSLERIFARFYVPLLAALTVYTFLLSNNCSLKSALCIHSYWLDLWLKGYESGLTRRGFLGWLHSVVFGDQINLIVLQLFGLLLIAFVFFLVYRSLVLLSGAGTGKKLFALMLASPVLAVFFETLGDPFQLCLAIFGLSCVTIASLSQPWQKAAVVFVSLALSILIHEASLLLIAPAYIFLAAKSFAGNQSIWKFLLLAAAVVGVAAASYIIFLGGGAGHGNASSASGSLKALNPITGVIYRYQGIQAGSFMQLLQEEYGINFGTYKHVIVFLMKPFRTGFVPVVFAAILAVTSRGAGQSKLFLKTWLWVCLCSFPLYVIAHDWGRFAIGNLIVALFAQQVMAAPAGRGAVPTTWRPEMRAPLGFALLIGLATAPINPSYRFDGLPMQSSLAVIMAWLTWLLFRTVALGRSAALTR